MSDDTKQTPRTTPAKLEELTAGRLSPDSRRKIRRAFGEGAMQALEDCRLLAYEAQLQQSVLARELLETTARLETRLTGVAAWCETNEKAAAGTALQVKPLETLTARHAQELEQLEREVNALNRQRVADEQRLSSNIDYLERQLVTFGRMTFWQRVRWMLGGTLPNLPPPPATVTVPRTPEEREAFAADIGRP